MPASTIVTDAARIGPWVNERAGGTFERNISAVGMERDGQLIVGVVYDNYFPRRSICMHVAAVHGTRWATREFLNKCFAYPFNQLGVNKCLALVDSTNLPCVSMVNSLGFVLEHAIKDAGRVGDLLIHSMTRQQCRYLGDGNAAPSGHPRLQHQRVQADAWAHASLR